MLSNGDAVPKRPYSKAHLLGEGGIGLGKDWPGSFSISKLPERPTERLGANDSYRGTGLQQNGILGPRTRVPWRHPLC